MARDPRWWYPTKEEWRYVSRVREDYDPDKVLFYKNGQAMAIWAKDKPVEDIEKGRLLCEDEDKHKGVPIRTEEDMERSMKRREAAKRSVIYRRTRVASEESKEKQAKRRKCLTADDPFEASVANAVDKDMLARNANYIKHAQRIADLPKIGLSDAEEVRERIDWYFNLCFTDGIKPNLPGLALCFGLTRTGLMNAVADRRMPTASAQELGRGIAMMDEILAAQTLDGRVNPVAAIYFMNNWLGYKNASEVTTRTETTESVDQKALERKYNTIAELE